MHFITQHRLLNGFFEENVAGALEKEKAMEIEQRLFELMLEGGAEKPTTAEQLQWALELVIFVHYTTAEERHPTGGALY